MGPVATVGDETLRLKLASLLERRRKEEAREEGEEGREEGRWMLWWGMGEGG
jgi:hypothetical protein